MLPLAVECVIKVGGGLLARPDTFDAVLAEIALASREAALLIVPGGGPFADIVRDVDRRFGLSDDAAHWMAILAMDQYAHLIASRLPNGEVVCGPDEIESALTQRRTPVLAPYQWMRDVDPLPHSWDVTSDSISAWVAGQVGAARLVLVKPPGASGSGIVDPCFKSVLSPHIEAVILTADRIDQLRRAIAAPAT
jgi:5-(aminomethyl)-3-furanmethanol phosphate kinase